MLLNTVSGIIFCLNGICPFLEDSKGLSLDSLVFLSSICDWWCLVVTVRFLCYSVQV